MHTNGDTINTLRVPYLLNFTFTVSNVFTVGTFYTQIMAPHLASIPNQISSH